MPIREGQFLELKILMYAHQAKDIYAEGMCRQLRVKPCT